MTEQLTWIGVRIGNYLVDSLISDGPFSWVYKATDINGGSDASFKVAKPTENLENYQPDVISLTQAKTIFEGGVADVHPDTRELLLFHYDKMQECHHPALIPIESVVDEPGICYLQMPYLQGNSLRDLIRSELISIETFIEIACYLDELSRTTFEYHGDLRPDNILITESGVKLTDSGYFGIMNCLEGPDLDCAITNCYYYPTLEPNDRMAFGIMLWEAALKSHPLMDTNSYVHEFVGDSLNEWIAAYEEVGQHFLSPLKSIKRPSDLDPDLDPHLEEIILQCMGLKLSSDGLLNRSPDEISFQDIVNSLNKIKDLRL